MMVVKLALLCDVEMEQLDHAEIVSEDELLESGSDEDEVVVLGGDNLSPEDIRAAEAAFDASVGCRRGIERLGHTWHRQQTQHSLPHSLPQPRTTKSARCWSCRCMHCFPQKDKRGCLPHMLLARGSSWWQPTSQRRPSPYQA